ncbi:hypothetical protein J6590_082415 [Homalodisca vitripennis]|nr:hypothetical protein J6590_082415 [Homalodisca vitripennis]
MSEAHGLLKYDRRIYSSSLCLFKLQCLYVEGDSHYWNLLQVETAVTCLPGKTSDTSTDHALMDCERVMRLMGKGSVSDTGCQEEHEFHSFRTVSGDYDVDSDGLLTIVIIIRAICDVHILLK